MSRCRGRSVSEARAYERFEVGVRLLLSLWGRVDGEDLSTQQTRSITDREPEESLVARLQLTIPSAHCEETMTPMSAPVLLRVN